ncbi:NAD(P)/FAD-dependent oxidoreductase [Halomonas denitrificans]|uniref:NAD(P)/FAD-dependent oxidoreductase n=1 Tax=Halomonas TaxID=2745 RepID=UPI001A8C42A8|nr:MULTISPECIES: NAD(P)/FAD-dependent oxidoreductase [Halomonas]MBN8413323.1 NAD(P)/FAD-dependent oxidoreductase [Halomonas litopenaei]MBY5924106.1 NAD(P)/FAD-dependent oxidoreductase [Halomonas sp. DP4Y7-2]MBY5967192.1 NAD(P)/FAD-dependent oxidoreductase [Halomonas denitrificans]MBY6231148.1 NAD(P)/FAD-dependent oxidoreductase [Halomonas sp. DP4Y7-1]MCA0974851.1 NAD(P)/FAD-dependent oxidoreductase [Halomonas denitrificans]
MSKPTIVVVGGGAGGLELVTRLGRRLGKKGKADVVLVDRNSTHIWKPLLHEVATGVLDSGQDEISYQAHSASNGYRFQRGTLCDLDRDTRTLTLAAIIDDDGHEILPARRLSYDYMVMAVGSVSNDFGTEGVADHCHFLDSPAQAEGFRQALLNTFMRYSTRMTNDEPPCITVGIIGAGATGVELAAELHDASRMLKSYGFTELGREHLRVHVIEAAPKILPALPDRISQAVHKELEKLGVKVHVDTRVTKVDEHAITTSDDERIDIDLGVWAAGIKAPAFLSELGLQTERNHRIKVAATMQSIDDPHIFAFGDCASCPQPDGKVVPPRAQAAHQQASVLYKNLCAVIDDKPLKEFVFRDRGSLISLAHFDAIGSLMRAASARSLFIEGNLARFFYASLYRMHQRTIHGSIKTAMMVVVDGLNRFLKPRLKLH